MAPIRESVMTSMRSTKVAEQIIVNKLSCIKFWNAKSETHLIVRGFPHACAEQGHAQPISPQRMHFLHLICLSFECLIFERNDGSPQCVSILVRYSDVNTTEHRPCLTARLRRATVGPPPAKPRSTASPTMSTVAPPSASSFLRSPLSDCATIWGF